MRWLTTLQRGTPLIEMTGNERRLIDFIVAHGQAGTWTILHGPNVGRSIQTMMHWHDRVVYDTIQALIGKRWLRRGQDDKGRIRFSLTQDYLDVCEQALERKQVRSALGYNVLGKLWQLLDEDDARFLFALDEIKTLAETLDAPPKFNDRLKLAYRTWSREHSG